VIVGVMQTLRHVVAALLCLCLFDFIVFTDLHMAQLMPLPLTVSCFSKIQTGFTFLVPAHPGSPGKRPLNGCVCVFSLFSAKLNEWLT